MPFNRSRFRAATSLGLVAGVVSLAHPAYAQQYVIDPMGTEDVRELPADMQSAPVQVTESTETTKGADGVETIVRTRRIETSGPATSTYETPASYAPVPYASGAAVLEREQWIDECNRRTSGRSEKEKGGIIGSLLGAVAGGIIGNRVAGDGDRLAGTLIGAGTGGLGGLLLGGLIGGGKKDDRYDCEAALDGYLAQYGRGPVRLASRTIAAPHYSAYGYPAYAHQGYYGYAPAYGCACAQPPQVVYVPVRYEQQQRVVVRETVREETYEVPGAARMIEERVPAPSPKMIKQAPPSPRPVKSIKQQ
ncbi:glycine zipper 2TM domain-containing protein [Erythrobacter sp. GH1-10]|uniref:glycine zipper 2TM domain-containing protein n=1 Tax=Erythrobacter sp. GH1-10 TaxID=3349334 RepID=UPI003877C05F